MYFEVSIYDPDNRQHVRCHYFTIIYLDHRQYYKQPVGIRTSDYKGGKLQVGPRRQNERHETKLPTCCRCGGFSDWCSPSATPSVPGWRHPYLAPSAAPLLRSQYCHSKSSTTTVYFYKNLQPGKNGKKNEALSRKKKPLENRQFSR